MFLLHHFYLSEHWFGFCVLKFTSGGIFPIKCVLNCLLLDLRPHCVWELHGQSGSGRPACGAQSLGYIRCVESMFLGSSAWSFLRAEAEQEQKTVSFIPSLMGNLESVHSPDRSVRRESAYDRERCPVSVAVALSVYPDVAICQSCLSAVKQLFTRVKSAGSSLCWLWQIRLNARSLRSTWSGILTALLFLWWQQQMLIS